MTLKQNICFLEMEFDNPAVGGQWGGGGQWGSNQNSDSDFRFASELDSDHM